MISYSRSRFLIDNWHSSFIIGRLLRATNGIFYMTDLIREKLFCQEKLSVSSCLER